MDRIRIWPNHDPLDAAKQRNSAWLFLLPVSDATSPSASEGPGMSSAHASQQISVSNGKRAASSSAVTATWRRAHSPSPDGDGTLRADSLVTGISSGP
jgi:hypothetical protein